VTICVIPARGGSKRIPKKNIKTFFGKPMIQWSIEAAQQSNIFDQIIVSTDDEVIADISKDLGVLVPFKRSKELSDDYTNTTDVIADAANWAKGADLDAEIVCCLYATAPFVRAADLIAAHEVISGSDWEYVFSVAEYSSPIFRSFRQSKNQGVEMFFPQHFESRSQDLPQALFDAGMFYMGKSEAWIQGLRIFENHSFPLKIPSWRVQDIDTPEDWVRAEQMAKYIYDA
jgi:pseudaminic acid cytidylyltransferase